MTMTEVPIPMVDIYHSPRRTWNVGLHEAVASLTVLPRKATPEIGDIVIFHPSLFPDIKSKSGPERRAETIYTVLDIDRQGTIHAAPLRVAHDGRTVRISRHDVIPVTIGMAHRQDHNQLMPPDFIHAYIDTRPLTEYGRFDLSAVYQLKIDASKNELHQTPSW